LVATTEEEEGQTDEYDSHPCLKDRLQALDALRTPAHTENNAPATTLLPNAEHHARGVLSFAAGTEAIQQLKKIDWEHVGRSVYWARRQPGRSRRRRGERRHAFRTRGLPVDRSDWNPAG
jgi:hypothetical protein